MTILLIRKINMAPVRYGNNGLEKDNNQPKEGDLSTMNVPKMK